MILDFPRPEEIGREMLPGFLGMPVETVDEDDAATN